MNYFKTGLLLAAMTALFGAVGFLIGGESGMLIALALAAAMNLFAYWNSDKMVLSMYGAREVDAQTAPEFYGLVQQLAQRAGLPMPKVYVIDNDQPNAFATGRNPENAAVAATTGLLHSLSREEIAGVMAHELGHVKNRDTLIMTVTATLAGAIGMLANFAMFFGGRSSDGNRSGLGIIGSIAVMIWRRSPPCWCRWRSAAAENTRPTRRVPRSAAIRRHWPRRCSGSAARSNACPMRRPRAIRPPRICSSSTRCMAARWTAFSRRIPAPRTVSPR